VQEKPPRSIFDREPELQALQSMTSALARPLGQLQWAGEGGRERKPRWEALRGASASVKTTRTGALADLRRKARSEKLSPVHAPSRRRSHHRELHLP
jgi:hypothetical protein